MEAGKLDQGGNSIGIGTYAASSNQAGNSIAIGNEAGATNQNIQSIAIGLEAGKLDQSSNSIGIGTYAAKENQGADSVAIGNLAAVQNQANNSIAIGYFAGNNSQQLYSIGIGTYAGENTQGVSSVAVGNKAGMTTQQDYSVAIGYQCGYDTQGTGSVAIGNNSGNNNQGSSSVAIGEFSGYTNQGSNCIAIGSNAGYTGQPANTNVIGVFNTTDTYPNSSATYIKPIRQFADAMSYGFRSLAYNPTTGEIVQGVSGSAGSGNSFDPFLGMRISSISPSTIYANSPNPMQMTIFCMVPLINTVQIGYAYTGATGPTDFISTPSTLNTSGVASFSVTPTTAGVIYFYIKPTTMWGLTGTSYISSTIPTTVSIGGITQSTLVQSLVSGTSVTGSTITLLGMSSGLTGGNFSVYLNTSISQVSNCTVTGYSYSAGTSTSTLTFTATPNVTGINLLYVKYTDLASVLYTFSYSGTNNVGYFVDASGSTFKQPTSFSVSPTTGYNELAGTTMTITTIGATGTNSPFVFYYGSSTGITSIGSLTQGATGTLISNTNTSSFSIKPSAGTWYPYIRIMSTSGITGPLIGSTGFFSSRSYNQATSIVSYTPTTCVDSFTISLAVTFSGYETITPGTALVYYSSVNTGENLIQIGTATALVSGVVTVSGTAPSAGTWYIYAQTVSPVGVLGPILKASATLSSRAYTLPTVVSSTSLSGTYFATSSGTNINLSFTPSDTVSTGTVTVYYSASIGDTVPTQCGTGTVNASGSSVVSCVFLTTGTYYLYAKVTAPNGTSVSSFLRTTGTLSVQVPSISVSTLSQSLISGTTTTSTTATILAPGITGATGGNFALYLNTTNTQVANSTITNYTPSTGVLTFTCTPTATGMNNLYVKYTLPGSTGPISLSYSGSNNKGYFVDAPGSSYTMATSFTYTPTINFIESTETKMEITLAGGSAITYLSIFVYYSNNTNATYFGAAGTTGATQAGSAITFSANAGQSGIGSLIISLPAGTWYPYVRVVSPLGVLGPLILSNTPIVSRVYTQGSSISYTPTTCVDSVTTTFTVTFGVYDSVIAGTAAVYYSLTNNNLGLTQIGTASAVVNGVVIVSGTIPAGTYYLYARTISPLSVQGSAILGQQFTSRTYNQATSIISYTPTTCVESATTTFAVTLSGYETITTAPGTAEVYYSLTNDYLGLTQIGTATTPVFGVVTVSGLAPAAGTYYLYVSTVSPVGVRGTNILAPQTFTSRGYTGPTSVSCTSVTSISSSESFNVNLSFSPSDSIASATTTVYFSVSAGSTGLVQCGTGTVDSTGSAIVPCTISPTGAYYAYASVTSPKGITTSTLLASGGTITITQALRTIDATTFGLAGSATDTFAGSFSLPSGFSSLAGTTNIGTLRSYYRDVTGEWAPSGTKMTKTMVRCNYDSGASVGINANTTGYAAIIVQCHTWTNSPSIIWKATPSSTSIKTQMTPNVTSYVQPPTAPSSAITVGTGISTTSDNIESSTRQPAVQFSQAVISGETGRWYNGIHNTDTSLFIATDTQSPSLGSAGDTLLQDFITIHQFNTPTLIEFTNINNYTWNVIGDALSSNVPSFCNTTTNKCSAARFGEFTVVPSSISAEELLSLGSDIANKWCVPYAGPSIKKFRLVNVGSNPITIGWVGIYKNPFDLDTLSTNLINVNTIYGAAGISVSSGSVSASWSATLMSTAPFQQIPAGGYIQFTLSSVVSNCGFVRLGKVTTTGSAKLRIDIQCNATVTSWEKYNLWYHYNGSAVQCTTIDCMPLNGTNVNTYALNNMFMPWKQKYGTTVAISPYYLPRYQAALEGSANQLNTWSSNLMAKTWDCNRAINHYLTNQRNGAINTFTKDQILNFKQFVADFPANNGLTDDKFYLGSGPISQVKLDKYDSLDGKYIITDATSTTQFMMTKQDYLPQSVLSVYGASFKQTANGNGGNGSDYDCLTLGFMDPNTFHTPFAVSMRNEVGRMPVNNRLRQSITTGSWYVDTPVIHCAYTHVSQQIQDVITNYYYTANTVMGGFPTAVTHKGTRSLFNYTGPDPNIGRIVDTLDSQKMFTISSLVGNTVFLFIKGLYGYGGYGTPKQDSGYAATIIKQSGQANGMTGTVINNVCTQFLHTNIGGSAISLAASNNGMNGNVFTPPSYAMFRSCTHAGAGYATGNALNDYRNDAEYYPGLGEERMYILTVVVNTQSNGGFFNSDQTMENYIKVYLNGKQINTANRRVSSGSYVTVTTSIPIASSSYPSYFYNSSALTYGITQITDATFNVATKYTKYSMLCSVNARGMTGMAGRSTFPSGQQDPWFESAAGGGGRISMPSGRCRAIHAETSNLCRATPDVSYSSTEIATHIAALSKKWGIVMAYRWVTIRNTGSVDFRFNRLGFYASHTEALSDSAGNATDAKMLSYKNIMKGFIATVATQGNPSVSVSCTVSSATVGVNGITAVLSQTGISAPSVSDNTIVTIQPGGSIMIDLADSITCSHVRFGNFASTGDVTLVRMSVDLTPTLPESEVKGTPVEHYLKASMNNSGVTVGQFPLYTPLTQPDLVSFVTAGGVHLNTCGVYVLYSSLW